MRPFGPQLSRPFVSRPIAPSLPSRLSPFSTTAYRSISAEQQDKAHAAARSMSSNTDAGELKIESTNIQTAPGVNLDEQKKTLVGSVLDLFAGRPSLAKLQLWQDEGVFTDPITIAQGRKQYSAQWYGLQTAFSEIERLHHEVKDAGNPIVMDLKTRYVVKGIGKEQVINSVVNIFHENGKISRVEDKWDGKLPDSSIANAFRHLNSVTVPQMVGVPKNAKEDAERGNQ